MLGLVAVRVTILGSGSRGNSTYLEAGETRLLIDAGLSARQIRSRLAAIGRSPETLTAILVTHEHADHVNGLRVLCRDLPTPVYCNRLTRDAILYNLPDARLQFRVFETGAVFRVGEVEVESFSVPHDAQDPVGFLIRADGGHVGFLTDLGHATRLVLERVRPAHALVLEANHDVRLLQEDLRRPWSVKQRILSRHGHLSNEAAADALAEILHDGLRYVLLGHLSQDCNWPELAEGCVRSRLQHLGATQVRLQVASQGTPSATVHLGDDGVGPAAAPGR